MTQWFANAGEAHPELQSILVDVLIVVDAECSLEENEEHKARVMIGYLTVYTECGYSTNLRKSGLIGRPQFNSFKYPNFNDRMVLN